jgi:prolyl 4-hydroxylase
MTYGIKDFIHMNYIDDISLCDDIIEFHKNAPRKWQGIAGNKVDITVKDSTDTELNFNTDLFMRYLNELKKSFKLYENNFMLSRGTDPYGLIEKVNVQHYKPNQAFHEWHCERKNVDNNRHLVFMTYLNDVTDGGETEFYYQRFKVKPKKGLTLIWPVDWTYTHRGIKSPTQDKYIVTGWLSFIPKESISNE